jgi:hypothetical protein
MGWDGVYIVKGECPSNSNEKLRTSGRFVGNLKGFRYVYQETRYKNGSYVCVRWVHTTVGSARLTDTHPLTTYFEIRPTGSIGNRLLRIRARFVGNLKGFRYVYQETRYKKGSYVCVRWVHTTIGSAQKLQELTLPRKPPQHVWARTHMCIHVQRACAQSRVHLIYLDVGRSAMPCMRAS